MLNFAVRVQYGVYSDDSSMKVKILLPQITYAFKNVKIEMSKKTQITHLSSGINNFSIITTSRIMMITTATKIIIVIIT